MPNADARDQPGRHAVPLGGNTPRAASDCSGLVNYVFRDMLDVRLPRTSRELFDLQGPRITPGRWAGGDLVFFGNGGAVSHVGIYVGEAGSCMPPTVAARCAGPHLDGSWWREHYTGARRLLHDSSRIRHLRGAHSAGRDRNEQASRPKL